MTQRLRKAAENALEALLQLTGQGRVAPSGANAALTAIAELRAALAEKPDPRTEGEGE